MQTQHKMQGISIDDFKTEFNKNDGTAYRPFILSISTNATLQFRQGLARLPQVVQQIERKRAVKKNANLGSCNIATT